MDATTRSDKMKIRRGAVFAEASRRNRVHRPRKGRGSYRRNGKSSQGDREIVDNS